MICCAGVATARHVLATPITATTPSLLPLPPDLRAPSLAPLPPPRHSCCLLPVPPSCQVAVSEAVVVPHQHPHHPLALGQVLELVPELRL